MKKSVLVVDDTPISRLGTVLFLESVGIHSDQAADGTAALDCVRRKRYDLILMDLNMPDITGIECGATIRAMRDSPNSATPIILLTANFDYSVRRLAIQEGLNDALDKQCSPNELKQAIFRFL